MRYRHGQDGDTTVTTALIVPSAGSGRRLGSGVPKGLIGLDGVPMVRRTLAKFAEIPDLIETVVVVPDTAIAEFNAALANLEFQVGDVRIVAGGASRQVSVRLGLEALEHDPELVCVHDAARPLVSRQTLRDVIATARRSGAATAASRPADSAREELVSGGTRVLDRKRLWMIETPQAFAYEILRKAHRTAKAMRFQATDDAALVEESGHEVTIIESSGLNRKITGPEDLALARLLISRAEPRR